MALLDFPNVIGLNGSNSDSFCGGCDRCLFHVSFKVYGRVILGQCDHVMDNYPVNTGFGHYVKLASKPWGAEGACWEWGR